MSMMWPPQRVKIVSIPSALSARATRCPPEISWGAASWPASVSSRIWSAVRLIAALLSQSVSLRNRRRGDRGVLIHIRPRALNMARQVQCVLAHQPLGLLGIAGLERLDDVHVVDHRALRAVGLADRVTADGPHMEQQTIREIGDHLRV